MYTPYMKIEKNLGKKETAEKKIEQYAYPNNNRNDIRDPDVQEVI